MNRRCGWKNRSVPTQGRVPPGNREAAAGRALSVSAAHCHLSRRARHWQAGPALLFAWARWGARCRALLSLAAATVKRLRDGPSPSVLRTATSPEGRGIGRPGQPCCSLGPDGAQGAGPRSHWQRHLYCSRESRQRSPTVPDCKNFARPARPRPTRQWLSLRESCHRR